MTRSERGDLILNYTNLNAGDRLFVPANKKWESVAPGCVILLDDLKIDRVFGGTSVKLKEPDRTFSIDLSHQGAFRLSFLAESRRHMWMLVESIFQRPDSSRLGSRNLARAGFPLQNLHQRKGCPLRARSSSSSFAAQEISSSWTGLVPPRPWSSFCVFL
jgi:hypothetical protein